MCRSLQENLPIPPLACRNSGFIIYGIGMHTHSSLIETGYKKKDCDEDSKASLKARDGAGARPVRVELVENPFRSCAVKRYPGRSGFKERKLCRKQRIRVSGEGERQFPALSGAYFRQS